MERSLHKHGILKAGGQKEGGWREDGRRMEGGWREDGGRMEGEWRENGGRMEGLFSCASIITKTSKFKK